jgi:hypothetical protein
MARFYRYKRRDGFGIRIDMGNTWRVLNVKDPELSEAIVAALEVGEVAFALTLYEEAQPKCQRARENPKRPQRAR